MTKGEDTRHAIVLRATQLASVGGLSGLSVGGLAECMGMSKSGVFAHFKSKEAIETAVFEYARDRFIDEVLAPAFKSRRGLPRLEAIVDRWLAWGRAPWLPGGCPVAAAGFEMDDRPGPLRDLVAAAQRDLLSTLAQAIRIAVDEGQLASDTDADQFAFELHGLVLAHHQATRLRHDPLSDARFRRAFERLVVSYTPATTPRTGARRR